MAPGSRHANGNVYRIDLDEGLEPCPAWLVAQIQGKSATYKNQQVNPKCYTSYSQYSDQRFEIRPGAELTADRKPDLGVLLAQLPKFGSTWKGDRATSPWPFRDGRNSPSEYEASIAFFLVWAGWSEQEVMDCIVVWRRERGLQAPVHYSRYACTLGKAVAMVTPRSKGLGEGRKESKGLYRHAQTKERVLGAIIETPKSPADIAQELGLN
jgi:hypothetical protein